MKRLHDITVTLLLIYIATIPLLFLPLTQDYYDTTKWYALLIGALLTGILWGIKYLRSGRVMHVSLSPVTLGLFGIAIAGCLSTGMSSLNKIEALLSLFGPVTFFNLAMLSLLIPGIAVGGVRKALHWSLFTSVSLLALISIYQFFGLGKIMLPSVPFLADPLWTPTGSAVSTAVLYILILPLMASEVLVHLKEKKETALALISIMTLVVLTGLGILLWQLIPKLSGILLPHQYGWTITLEMLKNIKQAAFGIGPENFLTAFSAGRPISYNMTPFWSVRFSTNSNFFFHIITIYGLLGLAGTLLISKGLLTKSTHPLQTISRIIGFLFLLITSPTLTVALVTTLVYIITTPDEHNIYSVKHIRYEWARIVIGLIVSICIGLVGYGMVRTYSAEHTFFTSLLSAQANNGTKTYNQQVIAIQNNPYLSRFHIIYSQTNLALATSLANSLGQPDSKATPEQKVKDRELVAQLIQQSIREAKAAVALNKSSILAWENMARIYQQLIDIAQGADSWADASFKQAIALDPNNPVLRLELGSIAMRTKNYTEAITHFQKSASLKPNYANAFYNLAYAYKALGDVDSAIRALTQTRNLVDRASNDYKTVTAEIEALQSDQIKSGVKTTDQSKTPTDITTPPPAKPIISPPIDLPSDSGPGGLR